LASLKYTKEREHENLEFLGAAPGGESLYRQATQSLWTFWVFSDEFLPGDARRFGCCKS